MKYQDLFATPKPIIGCIHLKALPGAPLYDGNMQAIYDQALKETELLKRNGIHGLIVENFKDKPFYPERVPAETIAAMSAIAREITQAIDVPVGINVLRNDAEAAMAIATAVGADFIRVNVHMNAIVSEQGIIQGLSHQTLRLRKALQSNVLIFADVGVKHAAPLASRGLGQEARDVEQRGLADAIIVSGELTGAATNVKDVELVRQLTSLPIIIGSGATPENIDSVYDKVNGIIVGSYFKQDGKGDNTMEEDRVRTFMQSLPRA